MRVNSNFLGIHLNNNIKEKFFSQNEAFKQKWMLVSTKYHILLNKYINFFLENCEVIFKNTTFSKDLHSSIIQKFYSDFM